MLGFYPPTSGKITVGDVSLENISHKMWRDKCGAVMQDGFIFSDSIAKNIAVGAENIDKKQLFHATKVANIQDLLEELPLAYNTKIGQEGTGISQGQRQRILIARAVYKNPEYIFFDEATNALDANNEKVIMENLNAFFEGNAYEQLQTQIKTWEQNYLLISPIDGVVTFTKYWQHNQNIIAGEVLATVVPQHKTKIIGKIELPPRGAGKVKDGQFVNVKFDNYPYMEYGMIKVQIAHISLVPINKENQKNYILEVVFPDSLVTNYGKTLEFSQEMTGCAEIITEDLRLLDKFLNPIRAIIKR